MKDTEDIKSLKDLARAVNDRVFETKAAENLATVRLIHHYLMMVLTQGQEIRPNIGSGTLRGIICVCEEILVSSGFDPVICSYNEEDLLMIIDESKDQIRTNRKVRAVNALNELRLLQREYEEVENPGEVRAVTLMKINQVIEQIKLLENL